MSEQKNTAVISDTQQVKEQGDYIFALDIGTRTVVGVIGENIDDRFIVRDYVSVPHTKRAMVDGQIEDIKQVAKIVGMVKEQLEQRSGIKLERVSIAAAGRALRTCNLTVEFDIPDKDALTEDNVKSMEIETIQKAQQELDAESKGKKTLFYCVGHSVTSYRLDDYKIISLVGHKGEKASVEMIAAFLPGVVVEGLYSVMDIVGLEVSSLTLEPIAAMNAIIPPEIRLINIALVDIGAGTSDIAIAKDGVVCAYAMATTAGDEITEEIIKTYFVDFATAEQLKQECGGGADELEYKDIFGLPHKVKAEQFREKLTPAVDVLAETICASIVKVNGSSPAAVFLIGGGCLVQGLPQLIAQKLSLDIQRVAIGGHEFLKSADTNGANLGAEFVTPIGIGITATLNRGYDFSVIMLNGEKIRVFDTRQLSVFELLNIAGYKSAEIMGRSGRNLTYTLGGKRVMKKGGILIPAAVKVNGKEASLTTKITQGDTVEFTPAVCGENAHAKLSDVIDYTRFGSGKVTAFGQECEFGLKAYVNGKEQPSDYDIQPLDEIETSGVITLGDLLEKLEIEVEGVDFIANGVSAAMDYALKNGDVIEYDELEMPQSAPEQEKPQAPAENAIPFEGGDSQQKTRVILNGAEIELAPNAPGFPHIFLDLLNYVNIDVKEINDGTDITLLLNGKAANFTDPVSDGDEAVIRLQERKTV